MNPLRLFLLLLLLTTVAACDLTRALIVDKNALQPQASGPDSYSTRVARTSGKFRTAKNGAN